jgi:putative protease
LIPIELLAPAKNLEYGRAAILHGADAVYIGAPRFSARAGASGTVADIEQLVRFAHIYRAKVYVAMNTILYDNEIDTAVHLIGQLYRAGIDALIIQDMGLLQCGLPPVPLFASTQTHNHSLEKIIFLQKAGFQRVILARELNLAEIKHIKTHTNIELECFVHGALCVSYSGQCYMSQIVAKRSGNRGICAQPCRSAYKLSDADGKILVEKAHLLSLKDLNLSGHLSGLLQAGITSFKIEGRLKDIAYVKNITAFYRQRLDGIFEHEAQWGKASSGGVDHYFNPDPYKTFNRGYTSYFIDGCRKKAASLHTQKSTGEKLGAVTEVNPHWFAVATGAAIHNGDGLCWLNTQNELEGIPVNRVENSKVFPARPVRMNIDTVIYRNNDVLFEKQLSGNSADRRISVSLELHGQDSGYALQATDEDGNSARFTVEAEKIPAKEPVLAAEQINRQFRKTGVTVFKVDTVTLPLAFRYFIPAALLNEMRRQTLQQLENIRLARYTAKAVERTVPDIQFPGKSADYRTNVANRHARAFYRHCGVENIEDALELQKNPHGRILMTTKYCIRYQYDACPVKQKPKQQWKAPLFLRDNHFSYRLDFDCQACMMKIIDQSPA